LRSSIAASVARSSARVCPRSVIRVAAISAITSARVAADDSTAPVQHTKKFHILHQRHLGKSAKRRKKLAATKKTMIRTADPQHSARIMCEIVAEPVNQMIAWQSNAKKTSGNPWVRQFLRDVVQRFRGDLHIGVQKPEHIALRNARACVHLNSPTAFGNDQLIAKISRKFACCVRAAAIDHDNFGARRTLAKMSKKAANQPSFIEHRYDDGGIQTCRRAGSALPLCICRW